MRSVEHVCVNLLKQNSHCQTEHCHTPMVKFYSERCRRNQYPVANTAFQVALSDV